MDGTYMYIQVTWSSTGTVRITH